MEAIIILVITLQGWKIDFSHWSTFNILAMVMDILCWEGFWGCNWAQWISSLNKIFIRKKVSCLWSDNYNFLWLKKPAAMGNWLLFYICINTYLSSVLWYVLYIHCWSKTIDIFCEKYIVKYCDILIIMLTLKLLKVGFPTVILLNSWIRTWYSLMNKQVIYSMLTETTKSGIQCGFVYILD